MKNLRNILTNPTAISVAIVHWLVVIFAIYGQEHTQPFHFHYEPILTKCLYLLNFLPMMFAGIILSPIFTFFGQNSFIMALGLFLNFLAVTFQWLIIGNIIAALIDLWKPEKL